MTTFNVGDYVLANGRIHGRIIAIEFDMAFVQCETCTGKHCLPFDICELRLYEPPAETERNYDSIGDPEFYDKDDIIDVVASFFEDEDNWRVLKNCRLINGRSDDLRRLLERAI